MNAYYQAKSAKYNALIVEDDSKFVRKLAKKEQQVAFWRATSKLWVRRGSLSHNALPTDCDEQYCCAFAEQNRQKYELKADLMRQVWESCMLD